VVIDAENRFLDFHDLPMRVLCAAFIKKPATSDFVKTMLQQGSTKS
jgi:hypothetical protein